MSPLERPCLARRVRLRWDGARASHVLLVPEGVVTLSPEAGEILILCDGVRTLDAVVDALSAEHPDTPAATLREDTVYLLSRLVERGYVRGSP